MRKENISDAVIRRLPRYYRFIGELIKQGTVRASSAELAKERGIDTGSVLIITSDFHMPRAKYIAGKLGMTPYGLTSDTWPWILKVNYQLREVFAFVKAWWKAR